MQTILGVGGAIGSDLAKALKSYTDQIRLVSRNPQKVNDTDEIFSANLLHQEEVAKAVEGSQIVYLTVGLEYKAKIWQEQWPKVMQNTIDACKKQNAKLVFFDNIYMYDPEYLGHMTENTPIKPVSKKGKVRAKLVEMIFSEVEAGNLTALIARSADFYGPGINNSVLQETVLKNLQEGKRAQWLGRADKKHSYTYTPDAAKATAILGNTPDAYNQVWHLPTDSNVLTGKELIELIAKELNVKPRYMTVSRFLLRLMSLFSPVMGEVAEMNYQYERDYVFDSSKFEKRFDFRPTTYGEGVKAVVYGKQ